MRSPDHIGIRQYCLMNYKPLNNMLFSNSISTGLRGNVEPNGLTYAIPLPTIVCRGINDVLFGFSTSDIIPVHPGNTLMLFVTITGIEICCINSCLEA